MPAQLALPRELDAASLPERVAEWERVVDHDDLPVRVPGDAFYRPIAVAVLAAWIADRRGGELRTRFETSEQQSGIWR
jgi:hypothetical protein